MQWLLDFSVTMRYILPMRLHWAEMQWLLDFSVTIRYVLPTRLQKAGMQWLIDFSVTIRYVLPTKLQRAEMQWLLDFSVTIRLFLRKKSLLLSPCCPSEKWRVITLGILNRGNTHGFHEICALFSPGDKFKTSVLTLQESVFLPYIRQRIKGEQSESGTLLS